MVGTDACASDGCGWLRNKFEKRSPSEGDELPAPLDRPNMFPLHPAISRQSTVTATGPMQSLRRFKRVSPIMAPKRTIYGLVPVLSRA